jgi:murein DD-endopeptidase MepM/ murein hydrolase activator NlpD
MNNEMKAAGIYWSTACAFAPGAPTCSLNQRPYIQVTYGPNLPPSRPKLLKPNNNTVTSSLNHTFLALPARDPEGETLKYKLQISQEESFSELIYESLWLSEPLFSYQLPNENKYYWRVVVQDEHGPQTGQTISQAATLTIDQSAPTAPKLAVEGPFTDSTENTICWSESTDNLEYQLKYRAEISTDNFDTVREVSDWINERCFTFSNLKNGTKYYYRIQAKDKAGNTSDYSNIESSTQDSLHPEIAEFSVSHDCISPNNPTSKGVKDRLRISAKVKDIALAKWTIWVINSSDKVLADYEFNNLDKQEIFWPDNPLTGKLEDGTYYTYIEAQDLSGKKKKSNTLKFEIDNTSPKVPEIISPSLNLITNTAPNLEINFEKNTKNYLLFNNTPIKTGKSYSFNQKLRELREGTNVIKAESIDNAGNRSTITRSFTLDTVPPSQPTIGLVENRNQKNLFINIKGESKTTALIYLNDNLFKRKELNSSNEKIKLLDTWTPDKEYKFYVKLRDKAGNTSVASTEKIFKAPIEEVLGVGSIIEKDIDFPQLPDVPSCTLEVNKDKASYHLSNCQIPAPRLAHILNYGKSGETYWLKSFGVIQPKLRLDITHKKCKEVSFWDPRTWFGCVEINYKTSSKIIKPRNYISNYVRSKKLSTYRQSINLQSEFAITSYNYSENKDKNAKSKNLQIDHLAIDDVWISLRLNSNYSNDLEIPSPVDMDNGNLNFLFNKFIGVTQWHGYTAYQSPHTGIDFGSYKEKVIAPADGYVRKAKWDDYLGECFSGGYYLRIEHDNGQHTVYLHMENFNDGHGNTWKTGDRILSGQQVGISGNTGAWNCQPLGYHLHFELRQDKYQRNHTDPVPHIDIDWDKVPTLDWRTYPGRLTGDNPHPTF